MKIRNTEGVFSYMMTIIWLLMLSVASYFAILFRPLKGMTYQRSQTVLIILFSTFTAAAFYINGEHNRNTMSAMTGAVFPFGVYTVLVYYSFFKSTVIITLGICCVLSIVSSVLLLRRGGQSRDEESYESSLPMKQAICNTYYFFAMGLFVIMFLIGAEEIFGTGVIQPTVPAYSISVEDDQPGEEEMNAILKLREETWNSLTAQERIDVLQVIANMECGYLGLPEGIEIGASNMAEQTLARYADDKDIIQISIENLMNNPAERLVVSVCHEVYHGYTHALIAMWQNSSPEDQKLKIFDDIKTYAAEYQNYQPDGDAYFEQKCEEDARKHGAQAAKRYLAYLYAREGGSAVGEYVEYDENDKAYLTDGDGNRIAGPYSYIEEPYDTTSGGGIRYIGENGLWGFLSMDGAEITPPKFVSASYMEENMALVSEKEGSVYFIDSFGQRTTGDYMDAYVFESDSSFTRVQLEDGKWAIINRQYEVVFSGADYITEIPDITTIGSAVVDGHAVMFLLNSYDDTKEQVQVFRELEGFVDISPVYLGEFAIVKNQSGLCGVADWSGGVIIDTVYRSIDYDYIISEYSDDDAVIFHLQNEDGTYCVQRMIF